MLPPKIALYFVCSHSVVILLSLPGGIFPPAPHILCPFQLSLCSFSTPWGNSHYLSLWPTPALFFLPPSCLPLLSQSNYILAQNTDVKLMKLSLNTPSNSQLFTSLCVEMSKVLIYLFKTHQANVFIQQMQYALCICYLLCFL